LEAQQLSEEEWIDLKKLAELLVPFERITQATQGNNQGQGSVISVLISMEILLTRLEEMKESSDITKAFSLAVDEAWGKLNKYYALTERSPIYVVSIILHPCLKMKYFEKKWEDHQDWIESALTTMNEYFLRYNHESALQQMSNLHPRVNSIYNDLDDWYLGELLSSNESELEQYLKTPTVTLRHEDNAQFHNFDIISWYKGNERQYPTLAKIAYDLYAIPSMSAEAERVFSRYVPLSKSLLMVQQRKQ
jgi:hypothetical protein